jgi:hypothetical protein
MLNDIGEQDVHAAVLATAVAATGAANAAHLHDNVREARERTGAAARLAVGALAFRGMVEEPDGGSKIGQGLHVVLQ